MSADLPNFTIANTDAAPSREDLLAAILETALDAIIVMDHEGVVRDWNPSAERTFGYSREEALGREMAELIIPPHLRERHRAGVKRAAATGRDVIAGQRIEISAMRRGGEEFPVELAITRIATAGAPMFAGHIRDITERRRLVEAHEASRKRWQMFFEQAPQSVMIFAPDGTAVEANPAYEKLFRTPRSLVIGWNILRDEQLIAEGALPFLEPALREK